MLQWGFLQMLGGQLLVWGQNELDGGKQKPPREGWQSHELHQGLWVVQDDVLCSQYPSAAILSQWLQGNPCDSVSAERG